MASLSSSSSPPKYPYPSEIKVADFVRIKLSITNYFTWRHRMFGFIWSQGLLGFINGEIRAPSKKIAVPVPDDDSSTEEGTKEIENQDYQDWERSDLLVRRWITETMDEYVHKYVDGLETAEDMWKKLKSIVKETLREGDAFKEARKDLKWYLPLHKAALKGDWAEARRFLEEAKPEPADALRAIITERWETALIVASRSVQRIHFVKKMVELMSADDLALADISGLTALHVAAGADNIEAAKLLVNKNPDLAHFWDADNSLPLHRAALFGRRKMVLYLLTVTKEDVVQKPFEDESGNKLVRFLIDSRLCDIALKLLERYPELACRRPFPLWLIAKKRVAFPSGTSLNLWRRLIYFCVPLKFEYCANHSGGDIENPRQDIFNSNLPKLLLLARQKLHAVLWRIAEILVLPAEIKYIREEKVKHHQALELLKHLCMEAIKLDYTEACDILQWPLTHAAKIGIREVVEVILESFPSAVYLKDGKDRTVFHLAIMNRCENVFELIHQFEELRHILLSTKDKNRNNGLHFAGHLASRQIITRVPGAALQMQRELQWFKEVERLSLPQDKEVKIMVQKTTENVKQKTPEKLFNETHEDLVKEGESWMRETANSCTIVAALVATVVFAGAITVPGGNNGDSGLPILSKEKAFVVFVISDALALFSSTSSVLIFLSILTSHYAQEDFLYTLPNRLIYGLVSLFLSTIFMMIAFSATLYLVSRLKEEWILITVAALACLPITLFASLQFPLLWNMIKSTYSSRIFCKKSDRILPYIK